jgi:hypothetical protein
MTDVGFVIAGYGVILGGLGVYAMLLLRRLASARAEAASRAVSASRADPIAETHEAA